MQDTPPQKEAFLCGYPMAINMQNIFLNKQYLSRTQQTEPLYFQNIFTEVLMAQFFIPFQVKVKVSEIRGHW